MDDFTNSVFKKKKINFPSFFIEFLGSGNIECRANFKLDFETLSEALEDKECD